MELIVISNITSIKMGLIVMSENHTIYKKMRALNQISDSVPPALQGEGALTN